jgi:hypothetical protein
VIATGFHVVTFAAVETGFANVTSIAVTAAYPVSARCDLDGDTRDEIVGGFDQTWAATAPQPIGRNADYDGDPGFSVTGQRAARCAELDRDVARRRDLVVLADTMTTPARRLHVLPNLRWIDGPPPHLETSDVAPRQVEVPATVVGDVLVDGDFDGDGGTELVVMGADGRLACFRGATLAACP